METTNTEAKGPLVVIVTPGVEARLHYADLKFPKDISVESLDEFAKMLFEELPDNTLYDVSNVEDGLRLTFMGGGEFGNPTFERILSQVGNVVLGSHLDFGMHLLKEGTHILV